MIDSSEKVDRHGFTRILEVANNQYEDIEDEYVEAAERIMKEPTAVIKQAEKYWEELRDSRRNKEFGEDRNKEIEKIKKYQRDYPGNFNKMMNKIKIIDEKWDIFNELGIDTLQGIVNSNSKKIKDYVSDAASEILGLKNIGNVGDLFWNQ